MHNLPEHSHFINKASILKDCGLLVKKEKKGSESQFTNRPPG